MGGASRHIVPLIVALAALVAPAAASAAPHAEITNGPSASTADTTAEFGFVASADTLFARFSCRVDGGEWQACVSPARYSDLANAAHTFEVKLEGIGADPAPARQQWLIAPPQQEQQPAQQVAVSPKLDPPGSSAPPAPEEDLAEKIVRCSGANDLATIATPARLALTLRCLLNTKRRELGLAPLRANGKLATAANRHANDMLAHRFFGHLSSRGSTIGRRARATGYTRGASRWQVGEAMHWGEGTRSTPLHAYVELLNSPAHRRLILSSTLRDVGIAAVTYVRQGSGKPAATYVVDMGRRWR